MIELRNLDEPGLPFEDGVDIFKAAKTVKTRKLYLSAASALSGLMLCGMALGFSSSALPSMLKESPNSSLQISHSQGSWIASIVNIGALIAVPISELYCEKIGRKDTMIISTLVFIFGNIFSTYSHSYTYVLLSRIVVGTGLGLLCISCPLYLFEIVHKFQRLQFEGFAQTSFISGILISYFLGYSSHWQWMAFISAIIGFLCLLLMFFAVESPYWLVVKDKKTSAIDVLKLLRGNFVDVKDECDDMEAIIIYQQFKIAENWKQLLQFKRMKPVLVIFGIVTFNQLSGAHLIIFYAQTIFQLAQTIFSAHQGTIFFGCVLTTLACFSGLTRTVFKWKSSLFLSQLGFTVCNLLLAIFFYMSKDKLEIYIKSHSWVCVIAFMIFAASYPINPILTDLSRSIECLNSEIKRTSHCILMMLFFFWSFIMTATFQQTEHIILKPFGPFFAFFAVSLIGTFYVAFIVPNVKIFDTDEIDLYIRTSSSIM